MKIIAKTGKQDLATVYIAEFENKKLIEFVESVQPPIPMNKKWVLIVSTLFGCPVKCKFCDAGGFYNGKLSKQQIMAQIDYLVMQHFPERKIPIEKFKIQFARMGEPALNENVLDVLEEFPSIYSAPGFMPSISTISPGGSDKFFVRLLDIKNRHYQGRFQLQFSIHSTSTQQRDWFIPVKKWSLSEIASYGNTFYRPGDRKITLNFALADNTEINVNKLWDYFDPQIFLIKLTPVNPTFSSDYNSIKSGLSNDKKSKELVELLKKYGYDVLVSIGEMEENNIGSNCGQHIMNYLSKDKKLMDSYTYELEDCIGENCSTPLVLANEPDCR